MQENITIHSALIPNFTSLHLSSYESLYMDLLTLYSGFSLSIHKVTTKDTEVTLTYKGEVDSGILARTSGLIKIHGLNTLTH